MHAVARSARGLAALCLLVSVSVLAPRAAAQSFPSSCSPAPGATLDCAGLVWPPYRYLAIACNLSAYFADPGSAQAAAMQADGFNNPDVYCSVSAPPIGWKTDPYQPDVVADCAGTVGYPQYFFGVERYNMLVDQFTEVFSPPRCLTTISVLRVFVRRERFADCPNANDPNQGWIFAGPYCYRGVTPDPNKNNGDSPNCSVANPVNPATGNKYERQVDYVGSGPYPLRFERFYNSRMRLPNDAGSVYFPISYFQSFGELGLVGVGLNRNGVNWRHSYERSIQYTPITDAATDPGISSAFALRQDGKVLTFTKYNGQFVGEADRVERLSASYDAQGNITAWQFISTQDDIETYDASGKLLSIANRAGLTQTWAYDASGRLTTVTDPAGRTLTFAYDASSRISTVTDPAGQAYSYTYDPINNLSSVSYPDGKLRTYVYEDTAVTHGLTGIVDENSSRYATWSYDTQGRATSSQHAGGADLTTLSYPASNTTSVTDAFNQTRTYSSQVLHGVALNNSVTGSLCSSCGPAATSYDANGNQASRTDFNGNQTTYTYDLTRNLETQRVEGLTSGGATTSATRTISTQWHATFRLPIKVAEPKRITTLVYDSNGNLTSKSIQATSDTNGSQGFSATPTGTARTWTYTNSYSSTIPGLLIQQVVDGPRTDVSDVTTYVWDNSGNLVTVTNALGQVTTLGTYDAHGRPQRITDPNSLVTTLAYDVRGRLTSRNVGGELTSYTYDGVGQLIQVTMPDGSFLAYTYDAAHRLTQIQDNLDNKITYTLDAMGNRTREQVTDPNNVLSQTRSRVYNSLNRLTQDIGALNQTTNYAYNNQGNLTSITDPLNHTTTQAFDALNRLVRMTDPNSGQTQYGLDGLDQVASVTDPRTLVTSYAIDGLGNTNQQASPDTGTTANAYDAAGNLVGKLDAAGVQAVYGYDALNRVISASYTAPSGSGIANTSILYAYDQGTNGIGRLTGVSDATGTTGYSYDQKGRLTQQTRIIAGQSYTTGYSYDSAGRLSGMTYPGGRQVSYTLDALGRVGKINTTVNGQVQTVVFGAAYRPFGPVQSFSFGSGSQLYARSFDLDARISGYTQGTQSVALTYDAASRITSLTNSAFPSAPTQYGYDNLDRVTGYSQGTTIWSYAYDADGNRVNLSIGANSYPYTISSVNNQLMSIAGTTQVYSYDAVGNLSATNLGSFSYDARHRLTGAALGSSSVTFQVNALGQRVQKIPSPGSATVFHYDKDGKLIAESDASGTIKTSYVYLNDLPVGLIAQSGGACNVSTAQVNAGTSFVPFDALTRLEVRGGRPNPAGQANPANWQWGLGTNIQHPPSYVRAYLNWVSGKAYGLTLTYDGAGNGTYTVSDGSTQLFSKTWNGGLRVGNALRLSANTAAGIGAGNFITVNVASIDGSPVNATLQTAGDNQADQATLTYIIPTQSNGGFTLTGTVALTFTGSTPPTDSRLDFTLTAGNVTCQSTSEALYFISPDQLNTPRAGGITESGVRQ